MSPQSLLTLLATAAIALPAARAEFTGAISPSSGDLILLEDGTPYLNVAYYDWGPKWSGVTRRPSVTPGPEGAAFRSTNTLGSTGANFTVSGQWSRPSPETLRLEATLTPEASSEVTLAQFALTPGRAFAKSTATVTQEDGTTTTAPVPFGRGTLGDAVKQLTLKDEQGRETVVAFDPAAAIRIDGSARLVLAEGRLEAGQPRKLGVTIKLPAATALRSDPKSFPDSQAGWYEFKGRSPIPAESEWSLQGWLEAPAGKHGRITRRGDRLVYNDKPIRLWGLNNSYAACAPDKALADRRADFYAALGINAVRLHKYGDGTGWAGILAKNSVTQFDPAKLDLMDYYVDALKKRGIYVKLSPVFIVDIGPDDRERVPFALEMVNNPKPDAWINPLHGSLYLSTELQDLLIEQSVALLKHRNPYTGLTYAEDPAVAYFELYNEDSALFGGVSNVMGRSPTLRQRAGGMFFEWLKKKYGTEEAFLAAWGPKALNSNVVTDSKLPTDESWAAGRIYPAGNPWFFDPSNLSTSQQPIKRRLLDTMAFLFELQNSVYDRYAKAVRDAGYEGELIASNWQAGRMMSHFYNLSSDARFGTIDRHNYFGGGESRFVFNNTSMLSVVGGGSFSSSLQQVDGSPFMLSEWIHVYPNEWGVEGPAILGAYGMGLQGWDVSFAFQNTDSGTFAGALGHQNWDVVAPQFLGIFPAVSRQVLRGDVDESKIVHYRNVFVPDLDRENVGFDEQVAQQFDVKTFDSDVFPARALAAVRGVVRFTDKFVPTETFDLTPFEKNGGIVASTGQLFWKAGQTPRSGHIEINTPGTQAVVGFAQDRVVDLAASTIKPTSRYGAIYLTAQAPTGKVADGPVLITAIARARNAGTIISDDILAFQRSKAPNGKPTGPVLMEPVTAEITLKRPVSAVHVLDHTGVKTGKTIPVKSGRFTLDTGRDASPYYLVE